MLFARRPTPSRQSLQWTAGITHTEAASLTDYANTLERVRGVAEYEEQLPGIVEMYIKRSSLWISMKSGGTVVYRREGGSLV